MYLDAGLGVQPYLNEMLSCTFPSKAIAHLKSFLYFESLKEDHVSATLLQAFALHLHVKKV